MSFKKNKYKIVKNAIPIYVANFVHDYFVIKRNVFATLKNSTYISKFNEDWGKTGDEQCPQSYSHYADLAMETILELLTEKMNKETSLKLSPTPIVTSSSLLIFLNTLTTFFIACALLILSHKLITLPPSCSDNPASCIDLNRSILSVLVPSKTNGIVYSLLIA